MEHRSREYVPSTKQELVAQMKRWWPEDPVSKWNRMKKKQLYAIWYRVKHGPERSYMNG